MAFLPPLRTLRKPLIIASLSALSTPSLAISYGIYDARGLAMGGSATAVGSHAQAAFYNPALLAFHEQEEEECRDGRVYLPTLVLQISDSTETAIDAIDDELDTQLSRAVNTFNSAPDASNAGQVAGSAQELRTALDKIANQNLGFDSFVGFNISEPSMHEGGAFYMGARLIGGGIATVTETDSVLLDDYINAMNQMAAGAGPASVAAAYPHLINARGQLIDPTNTLTSGADISALAITEWGMAMAKSFEFFEQTIAFGITPKLMRVDAFRDTADFNDNLDSVADGLNEFSDTRETHISFNADLGIAATIADHYRISLTLKDAFAKQFSTHQAPDPVTGAARPELKVSLSSRARMGVGYINDKFSIGVDYDLSEATPMATEASTQELSLGAEYVLFDSLALRAGYRTDQTSVRGNIASVGIGYRWQRFVIDAAYASGGDYRGGGLQMGWTF